MGVGGERDVRMGWDVGMDHDGSMGASMDMEDSMAQSKRSEKRRMIFPKFRHE